MEGGLIITYCARCGAQNSEGARFCNYCGSPLEVKAAAPPGVTAPPYQPPYQPPYPPPQRSCESRPREQEECLGQTKIPGFIVFALIILLIAVFALIQWYIQVTYPTTYSTYSGLIWPVFGVVLALVLIIVWLVARPRAR